MLHFHIAQRVHEQPSASQRAALSVFNKSRHHGLNSTRLDTLCSSRLSKLFTRVFRPVPRAIVSALVIHVLIMLMRFWRLDGFSSVQLFERKWTGHALL
jgi:hypothetical protein